MIVCSYFGRAANNCTNVGVNSSARVARVALCITSLHSIEKVLRLSQTPEQRASSALVEGREAGWDKGTPDKKDDAPKPPSPPPRPRPHWNGPKGRATLAGGGRGGGGGGGMFMLR